MQPLLLDRLEIVDQLLLHRLPGRVSCRAVPRRFRFDAGRLADVCVSRREVVTVYLLPYATGIAAFEAASARRATCGLLDPKRSATEAELVAVVAGCQQRCGPVFRPIVPSDANACLKSTTVESRKSRGLARRSWCRGPSRREWPLESDCSNGTKCRAAAVAGRPRGHFESSVIGVKRQARSTCGKGSCADSRGLERSNWYDRVRSALVSPAEVDR